jgi:hypothetical protein
VELATGMELGKQWDVRFAFSMLLLSLVAFAAGYWRRGAETEGDARRRVGAVPAKEADGNGARSNGAAVSEAMGARPGTEEMRRILGRLGVSWAVEPDFCRVLLTFGVEDFRGFAKGTGALFEAVRKACEDSAGTGFTFSLDPSLHRALVMRWVELDRTGALAWWRTAEGARPFPEDPDEAEPARDFRNYLVVNLGYELTRCFAEEVLADPELRQREGALGRALQALASRKPQEARAWLARLPPEQVTKELREMFDAGLVEIDPEAMLAPVLAKPEPLDDFAIWADGSMTWPYMDRAIKHGPVTVRRLLRRAVDRKNQAHLAVHLAKQSPGEGAEILAQMFAENSPEGFVDNYDIRKSAAAFAVDDPIAAARWAEGLTGPVRAEAMKGVANGWATRDGAAAMAWAARQSENAASLPPPKDSADPGRWSAEDYGTHTLQLSAYHAWQHMDAAAAQAWLDAQEENGLRNRILTGGGVGREQDVRQAAALCLQMTAEQMGSMASGLAAQFVEFDRVGAATWGLGLPEGSDKDYVLRMTMEKWGETDPEAVLTWLQELPAGPAADLARVKWVEFQPERPPEEILMMIEEIADARLKTEAARRHFRRWKKVDGPAARRWLAELEGINRADQGILLDDE